MRKVNLRELNKYEKEAITQFVKKETDLFVNLPTGAGKSLIYLALPVIVDTLLLVIMIISLLLLFH